MHTQNTQKLTHRLKFNVNWEKREEALIGHLQSYVHTCTKYYSPPEVDNGLKGKGERH